jgi:hypothetical protein
MLSATHASIRLHGDARPRGRSRQRPALKRDGDGDGVPFNAASAGVGMPELDKHRNRCSPVR